MGVKNKINFLKQEDGQSIFEFIAFAPFYIVLLAVFINITGAINGSINQQKITRAYFYYNLRGNSTGLDRQYLTTTMDQGIQNFSMYSIGYMEKRVGQTPEVPCYEVKNFIPGAPELDSCQDKPNNSDAKTQFIRVNTMYGICTELLVPGPNGSLVPNFTAPGACSLGG